MHAQPCKANGFVNYEWILYEQDAGTLASKIFEYKLDGDRRALVFDGSERHFYSKRESVHGGYVDKIQQVPQFGCLLTLPKKLPMFALDGEAYLPGKAHADLTSVIGSTPERAAYLQGFDQWQVVRADKQIHYTVFNQIIHKGESIRHRPYRERRMIADATVATLVATNPELNGILTTTQQFTGLTAKQAKALFTQSLALGHEGLMVKDPDAMDGEGLWKWKVWRDTCVLITGMTHGKGKYKGQVGAVQGSVRRGTRLVEVTQTSGMDDAFREALSKARGKWYGLVAEVRGQGIDVHGRIRHPRFRFMKPEVDPKSCTWDQYLYDMSRTDIVP